MSLNQSSIRWLFQEFRSFGYIVKKPKRNWRQAMALDVYVMPLWKFKTGDYTSPLRRQFGDRVKTVGYANGMLIPAKQHLGKWKAQWAVRSIRKAVEKANGIPITWNDEGETVYAEQFHGSQELRLFAKWLNCRDQLPEFNPPENGKYDEHPATKLKPKKPLFCPQLVNHDCWAGYLLPMEFDVMPKVEPYMQFGKIQLARSVGSSPRILNELAIIQEHLKVPNGYKGGDPLDLIMNGYIQMKKVIELSIEHQLPVIFFG